MPKPRVVHVHNAHPCLRLKRRAIAKVIHTLDLHRDEFLGGCPEGELSLAFLTDDELARVHANFLHDPTATDVITFEGNPALSSAGEICVSADTAIEYASRHNRHFSTELTLYVVHGWLHLSGYDDLKPEKKRRMRAAEKRAMKILSDASSLPEFIL